MKAISFFFAVFISMLAVFLVATGEVKRWFSARPEPQVRFVMGMNDSSPEVGSNKLHFDFFNVKIGEKSFTIDAELSQDNFQVGSKVDEINELALRDGVIRIPIHGGIELLQAPGGAESRVEEFIMQFKSALWRRGGGARAGEPMSVLLKDGSGRANDGTEMFFQDLIFQHETDGGSGGSRLRSEHEVSIRNQFLDLRSPNGLEGKLTGSGLESLTFHPPVTAVLDAGRTSLVEPGAPGPGGDSPAGAAKGGEPPSGSEARHSMLVVTCQGPLEVQFVDGGGDRESGTEKREMTVIRFRKDVTVYGADKVEDATAGPGNANRFECQELLLEIVNLNTGEESGRRLAPRRALATWEGGRVKTVFHRGSEVYVVDGDRLEWLRPEDPNAPADFLLQGEAVLSGKPTLRKQGAEEMLFDADRALLRLGEDSVVFESVRGTLDFSTRFEKKEKKRSHQDLVDPRLSLRRRPKGAGTEAGSEVATPGDTRGSRGAASKASLPKLWDVSADEVEFLFHSPGEGKKRELEGFIARARKPDGVEIKSHTGAGGGAGAQAAEPAGAAEAKPVSPFRATGNRLTYLEAGRQATLEGTPDAKPRLTRDKSWMDARQIHLFPEDGIALFEGEARAQLVNLKDWSQPAGAGEKKPAAPASQPGEGEKPEESVSLPSTIDLEADTIEMGFLEGEGELSYIEAVTQAPGSALKVTSPAEPWFRLAGQELYWDEEEGTALFYGSAPAGSGSQGPKTIGPLLPRVPARLETRGGDLLAQEIHFDRKNWKATLSDEVIIRTFPKGDRGQNTPPREEPPDLEMTTGRAVVDFFEGLGEGGGEGASGFKELRRIKALHATQAPDRRIVIRGTDFVGRAEEVAWDSKASELRFYGKELQEIEILRDDFAGPVRAKEIVYHEDKNLVVLRGDVKGKLVQARSAGKGGKEAAGSGIQAATHKEAGEKEPPVWWFETDLVEVQLRRRSSTSNALELATLHARERVLLRNEAQGLQLRGDHLTYDDASRKMRLFSPDGRTQTLLYSRGAAADGKGEAKGGGQPAAGEGDKPEDRARDKTDKIDAQEIFLLYQSPQTEFPGRSPQRLLLVEFQRDVIATFELSPTRLAKPLPGAGESWKMLADGLVLHVDPDQDLGVPQVVPKAVARGKVVFQSGDYEATADRAVYEEAENRLTLFGATNSPARLFRKKKAVTERETIHFQKVGENWQYTD